jgi:hypothetical protein
VVMVVVVVVAAVTLKIKCGMMQKDECTNRN